MKDFSVYKIDINLFYDKYKSDYLKIRGSTDKKIWDEKYKWDILPKLSHELSSYKEVTKENIQEIFNIYKKYNPSSGTFIDWRDADDLTTLFSKPHGWQLLRDLWDAKPDNVAAYFY